MNKLYVDLVNYDNFAGLVIVEAGLAHWKHVDIEKGFLNIT